LSLSNILSTRTEGIFCKLMGFCQIGFVLKIAYEG
jgi:hypothetical protein